MSVRSMGCSNGAEADSVLAHHWRSGDTRDFSITGNDISPSALEQARRGRYRVLGRGPIEALHSYGFDVEPEMQGRLRRRPMLMVDAGPVRQGYEVEFVEHDGTEPLAVTEEDDLIFANNLLYHLSDEEAIQIARNLASVLSEHGVLVLGGSSLSHDSPIDGARVSGMLNEEFGLEPLFVDSADTPVMFGRT